MIRRLASLLLLSAAALAAPRKAASQPVPSLASTIVFNNVTFVNKGLASRCDVLHSLVLIRHM